MGEVGTNSSSTESPSSMKMNGINGNCGEEDPIDSQDDSQGSSELSTTKKSENGNEAHKAEITKSEVEDVADGDDVDTLKKPNLDSIPENSQEPDDDISNHSSEQIENGSTKENGDDGRNSKAESSVDDENDNEDIEMANVDDIPKKLTDDYEDEDDEELEEELDDATQEGSEAVSEDNIPPAPVELVDDEVSHESDAVSDAKNPLDASDEPMNIDGVNGESSGVEDDNDVQHVPIVHEVHAISDSEDEEYQSAVSKSSLPSNPLPEIEHMDVDSVSSSNKANGHKKLSNNIDDDKPVSIHSDSENENESSPNKNGTTSEIHKILSDNEDCVVIEDDNNKKDSEKGLISPRRSTRARKSVVKVRDFSAFDDDIEEVVEDPLSQPAAKKLKTSPTSLGITIQDARSLATDPLISSTSFQQSFMQAQGVINNVGSGSGTKKEPTLVIIDTNQIMSHGGSAATVQALQNQNFSVHPVGVPAQGIYPTSMRASITPILQKSPTTIATKSPQISSLPITSGTVAPLLPALTDDMFVLEAPSFIVPYIYEKPPSDNLKDIVEKVAEELAARRKKGELDDAEAEAKEIDTNKELLGGQTSDPTLADSKGKKKKSKNRAKNGDESWDESDTSTDDEASDSEQRTKILIKEANEDLETIKTHIIAPDTVAKDGSVTGAAVKRDNYFESPLGNFFMDIGINLVQEHVQTDLLRQQKKKLNREGDAAPASIQQAINSLKKNLEHSKSKNECFKFETKRCEYCNFKSESALSMAHHYETPHMNALMYKCNFCSFESRPPYDILFHMEAVHNIKARLEKAVSYHQCPNCPFEDNGRSKLARHALVCAKKFRPEVNLNPPMDWEPPAKIPRIKPRHGLVGTATAYQAMAAQAQRAASTAAALQRQNIANAANAMRGRGRPQQTMPKPLIGQGNIGGNNTTISRTNNQAPPLRPQIPGMILPNNFQLGTSGQFLQTQKSSSKTQQPSISITPLPRQPSGMNSALQAAAAAAASNIKPPGAGNMKPGQSPAGGGKASFVICEICDGYIKDLDQLRNHMQWMHKVKIHPKMIYNRPPLNCQKCQFRFFTDQGLERHLLGSHGLVTSSMQEAANKGKDAGRCPVCGRMYQWKLLNHVSRDHNMTLKPAHLSYKCTVCTATFGMYKQFENHVYSAHSTVAKKAMDGKKNAGSSSAGGSSGTGGNKSFSSGESLLKPLKINDEITIIPQPAQRQSKGQMDMESHVIEII